MLPFERPDGHVSESEEQVPEGASVELRLRPLNGVLAIATVGELNATVLADAGFRVAALEVPVGVGAQRVVVDLLLVHARSGLLVPVESKSGPNIEPAQAEKYASLDPQAVVLAGSVDLPEDVRPTVAVLYVCLADHSQRIQLGLSRAGLSASVLAVGGDHVELLNRHSAPPLLHHAFRGGPVPLPAGVPRIIPCDHESPIEVVRPHVKATLVAHLSRRSVQVAASVVAAETLASLPIYGQAARNRFQRTVDQALRLIATAEPDTFEFLGPTGSREGLVRFLKSPEANDPRGRTQAYQALTRRGEPRRRSAVDPNQLDLLQELESADDVGGNDDTERNREDDVQ